MHTGQVPISLHILTLLCQGQGTLVSSEHIAGSVNINPVLVRKEISNLRKHGLIATKEGKNGGSFLAKPADKIVLSEVYLAIKNSSLLALG
jgi:DNA-binding IscR family transcriptional regulator